MLLNDTFIGLWNTQLLPLTISQDSNGIEILGIFFKKRAWKKIKDILKFVTKVPITSIEYIPH